MLQGDANTAYFYVIANGRRRKCAIMMLSSPAGPIMDKLEIQAHIYEFYRNLMSSEDPRILTLINNLWSEHQRVSGDENEAIHCPFPHRNWMNCLPKLTRPQDLMVSQWLFSSPSGFCNKKPGVANS
jgi:hypothetical protein